MTIEKKGGSFGLPSFLVLLSVEERFDKFDYAESYFIFRAVALTYDIILIRGYTDTDELIFFGFGLFCGGKAHRREHHAPPILSLAVADNYFQRIIFTLRKAKLLIAFAGVMLSADRAGDGGDSGDIIILTIIIYCGLCRTFDVLYGGGITEKKIDGLFCGAFGSDESF